MRVVVFIILIVLSSCFNTGKISPGAVNKLLDVLIITDERKFNRDAFFAMFGSFEDVRWTELRHPAARDIFGSDSINKYDAIVFYDMPEDVILTEKQKREMVNFFNKGAPAIFLHHSLLSYREWDVFPQILGGRYFGKTPLVTSAGDTIQSTYEHDVRYKVKIVNKTHPVTRGVKDFEIFDEVYNNYFVRDDVELLLTTDHPKSGRQLGWVNHFGKSKIVFLINGHNETAYNDPNFRKLLYNAMYWAAKNKEKGFK